MTRTPPPTCVIVPGMRDHVPEHWQTVLAHQLPDSRTVPPLTEDRLSRDAQVSALDDVLAEVSGPVVLVAHSAGVMTTVHWAQRHRRPHSGRVAGRPSGLREAAARGLPDHYDAARERLDADPAQAPALPEHRDGEQQRPAGEP